MNQFSSPVLQTCTGDKKNKPRTTIIYTLEREDKIIDSESCVNVREWCACVNNGDRLLSMFCVNACSVCVFEQCEICNKRPFAYTRQVLKTWMYIASKMFRWCFWPTACQHPKIRVVVGQAALLVCCQMASNSWRIIFRRVFSLFRWTTTAFLRRLAGRIQDVPWYVLLNSFAKPLLCLPHKPDLLRVCFSLSKHIKGIKDNDVVRNMSSLRLFLSFCAHRSSSSVEFKALALKINETITKVCNWKPFCSFEAY